MGFHSFFPSRLLLLALSSFLHPSLAAPSTEHDLSSNQEDAKHGECGFVGNADIYGLGIRIGYYTQSLSVWFAHYFVLSESKTLRSINLVFVFAVFIGLAWLSHKPSQCHAVEAYFLNHLLVATWRIGVVDRSRFSRKYWRFSPVYLITEDLVLLAMMSYSTWYFWIGLDYMEKTPCGTFVFVIVKVDLYGWLRTVAKILCVIAMAQTPVLIVVHGAELYRHWYTAPIRAPEYYQRLRDSFLNDSRLPEKDKAAQLEILEVAAGISLPASPEIGSQSSDCESTSIKIEHKPMLLRANAVTLPTIVDLQNAEAYLDHIHSLPTSNTSPHIWTIPHSKIRVFFPSLVQVKRMRSRIPTRRIFTHRPFRFGIIVATANYIYEQRTYPLYAYPKMYEMALESPYHEGISFETLYATMRLRTVRLPDFVPPAAYLPTAVSRFGMLVVLVVSLELSMHWNSISGMGSFGAVGQLIPAVLGIGGLVRVLWVWWEEGSVNEMLEEGVGKEVRECADVYEKMKGVKETGCSSTDAVV